MPIRFRCTQCQQLLSIATRKAGEQVECPLCGAAVTVPVPEPPDEAGLTLRRPRTEFEEMDLTPMVDVTFLLLIFFMITASFNLQKTLEVPPPDPDRQGATQSVQTLEDLLDESIKVEIDGRNAIFIDDEPLTDRDGLTDALRDRMRSDLKTELVLLADAQARHETVVAVVDAANEVGLQRIRLVTRAEEP